MATEKFLKQRALNIAVEGHYSLPNWYDSRGKLRTFACRTTRVSPFRMLVDVPVVGKVGDRLISYFHDFGKLDGHISDTKPGSFLLELDVTHVEREKLAKKLTWLEGKLKDPGISDPRQHRRMIPSRSRSTLTLADGTFYECFIIDMSVTGAAVSAEVQPAIGTPLAVGACVGRVVRVFASGFAVKFVERQDKLDLNRLIARPMPRSSTGGAKATSDSDNADVERMKA